MARREVETRTAGRPTRTVAIVVVAMLTWASGQAAPGGTPSEGFEDLGLLLWRFTAGGPVRATPALRDGILYVGSTAGHLHTLDAETGESRWRYEAGAPVVSGVTVAEERVFLQARDGSVHALRSADGSRIWREETGPELSLPWGYEGWDYVGPTPVLVEGAGGRDATLLVAAGDGNLYALDPDTGARRWHFATGARLRATPAVEEDIVYLGDGAGIFHALRLEDGHELWRFATDGHSMDPADFGFDRRQIYSSVAISDGRLFFGSRDANVYALDAATGALLWKADDATSAWVMGTPTVADGRVYVTRSSSARVRALDAATGDEIWSVQASGPVFTSPRLVDGTLLVGDEAGNLLALDARSGEHRWRYGLGGAVWAAPLVADGRLYVGSDDGHVYAFARRQGPTPRLALFWDDDLTGRSVLGAEPWHRAIPRYFERRGYETLDAAGVAGFMESRVADSVSSAVVFAMDALPGALSGGDEPRNSVLRRYLEAGGKVVWLGRPPGLYVFDEEGRITGMDRSRPAVLLGVDHGAETGDRYPAWPTAAGHRIGLETWWIASPSVPVGVDVTALAVDELGRPVAWVREYGSDARSGGSFVHLYPTLDTGRLDEVREVVEHELFRSAATRETEHR